MMLAMRQGGSRARHGLFPSPRAPSGLAFGKPKGELRAWRGGVRGGGRRLFGASVVRAYRKFGTSVVPPPLAPQLRCAARPSPPKGGRVAAATSAQGKAASAV